MRQGSADPGEWYRPARVHLDEYQEHWPLMYADEAGQIAEALGDDLVVIEHVGSTAIPGMPAKPIIDILVAVTTWDRFDEMVTRLGDLRYVYTPESEDEDPDRRVFRKGPAEMSILRTHHLHVTEPHGPYWKRIIAFRDQLRSDPADATAYVELKRSLATRFEHDSRSYTGGKHDFVKAMEHKRGVLGQPTVPDRRLSDPREAPIDRSAR